MALSDVKRGLDQGNTREKSEAAVPSLKPAVSPEPPAQKDASVFGRTGYIAPSDARGLLRNAKGRIFSKYGLRSEEVEKLATNITNESKFGSLTNPDDLKKYEDYRKKGIKEIKNLGEKENAKRILEKEMRILKDVFPNGK